MYLVMELNTETLLVMDHRPTGTAAPERVYTTMWFQACAEMCDRIGNCRLVAMRDEDVIHKLPDYQGGS